MRHFLTYFAGLAAVFFVCGCGGSSGHRALRDGVAAFKNQSYERAVGHFNRAAKRISDSPELYYNLGRCYQELGQIDGAKAALEAALDLDPDHVDSLTALGQVAYHQKEFDQAYKVLKRALALSQPGNQRARILNSISLVEGAFERTDMERVALLRAIREDRLYAPAYYNLASIYRDKYQLYEEALDNFELCVRLLDKNDHYHEKAGRVITRLRANVDRTRSEENDRIQRDPAKAATLLRQGETQRVAKQFTRAVALYREALAADPLTFGAAFGQGIAHSEMGQRVQAMEAFRQAAQIQPDHLDSYCRAAELALELRKPAEAAQILERAIARQPASPAMAELMARICHAGKRLPEARAYGSYYLSLVPAGSSGHEAYQRWVDSLPAY